MTSAEFHIINSKSITVTRDRRQRKTLDRNYINELAASINQIGLINPIVITRENELVAGECRLTAIRDVLEQGQIPVQYVDELEPDVLHLIELEENVRRRNLTWQEECEAVEEYHKLKAKGDKAWTVQKTADQLALSQTATANRIQIAEAINDGDEDVKAAGSYTTGLNILTRKKHRANAALAAEVETKTEEILDPDATPEEVDEKLKKEKRRAVPLLNQDFLKWAAKYKGTKFTVIHCDFPYGINADQNAQGSAVETMGNYDDSLEVYEKLITGFAKHQNKFVAPTAHMIFWFPMQRYTEVRSQLESMGWYVNPIPLTWTKSCNTGLAPKPQTDPRQIVEFAFFCYRGEAKLVKMKSNGFAGPSVPSVARIHMSEKSPLMLSHFLEMIVDDTTTFLDPTCGSARAVKAAEELGARQVLGIELDTDFFLLARERYLEDD